MIAVVDVNSQVVCVFDLHPPKVAIVGYRLA